MSREAPSSSTSRLGGCFVHGCQGTKREVGFGPLHLKCNGGMGVCTSSASATGWCGRQLRPFGGIPGSRYASRALGHAAQVLHSEGPKPCDEESPRCSISRSRPATRWPRSARAVIFSCRPVLAVGKNPTGGLKCP